MKNRFGLTGRLFIITMLALAMVFTMTGLGSSMPAKPVLAGDDGLRSGYSTVGDWNSTITGTAPTPTTTPAQAGSCDWNGRWKTNHAGLTLIQTGSQVTGTYGFMGETMEGTVSGNTFTGTWRNPSNSASTGRGEIELTMADDCNSFTGRWRYDSAVFDLEWDGIWTGTRIGAAPTVDSDGDGVPDGNDQCPGTPAGVAVDANGCPGLNVTISVDKTEYSAGETAVIRGSVSDVSGAVAGAGITVDVSGWKGSATTDAAGNYQVKFPIPASVGQPSYAATATASHNGKTGISPSVTLSVGQVDLIVTMTTNKDHYYIGDTVYCKITVKDPKGEPVSRAQLQGTAKHLSSGRTTELSGSTNPMGENDWSFTWGQDNSGKTIAEGKLQIDITASKDNAKGKTTVIICGCGDLEKAEVEDCLDCPEDCPCDPKKEVCDPSSVLSDRKTMCSPKIAYIFISNGLSSYEEWFISNKIKYARKLLQKLGYRVRPNIHVGHIEDIAQYLSRPSTKAIAYFGHGVDPGGIPTIEAAEATKGNYSIKEAITNRSKQHGGFLYTCQYDTYAAKWVENKDKIEKIAQDKADHPNLENAYIWACYSLDDYSLRDYLLESGGGYWGYRGVLPGDGALKFTDKPW